MELNEIALNLDGVVVAVQPTKQISQFANLSLDDGYQVQKLALDRQYSSGRSIND